MGWGMWGWGWRLGIRGPSDEYLGGYLLSEAGDRGKPTRVSVCSTPPWLLESTGSTVW